MAGITMRIDVALNVSAAMSPDLIAKPKTIGVPVMFKVPFGPKVHEELAGSLADYLRPLIDTWVGQQEIMERIG